MSKRIEILTEPEITKLGRGGFSVRFRIPAHHGQPEKKSPRRKVQAKNLAAARRAAEDYRRELEDEINDYTHLESISFGEYARRWHEDRKEMGTVKITTWERDELEIRQIEQSVLGHIPISEVGVSELDNFKLENIRAGFSNDKQDKLLKKAKQILNYAEKRRAIRHNPSGAVDNIKRRIQDKRKALTKEEQDNLLKALESEDISGKTVVVRIAFSTGFRRGECLGLQWGDIDFKKKTINLVRQLNADGEFTPPKYDSMSLVPMGDGLIRYLRRWKQETSTRFYDGGDVPDDSPVCRNDNGKQLQAANFDKWRREWFVQHGLGEYTEIREEWDSKGRKRYHKTGYKGYRLHELRHTMATELVSTADLKTAQTLLRHSNISTTAGYIHEIDENIRAATALLDEERESGGRRQEDNQDTSDAEKFDEQLEDNREKAYKRQQGKCPECGEHFDMDEMVIGLITPYSEGEKRTSDNYQLLCRSCNAKKGNK